MVPILRHALSDSIGRTQAFDDNLAMFFSEFLPVILQKPLP